MTDDLDDQGRPLLHTRPLPPIGEPRPEPVEKKPWVHCPECGVGPGADHLKSCDSGRKKFTPMLLK